ncbi:MAG: type II toxin-antitoxin system RelE/ParE family toxin [Coriobacteriia bacterium]|nr:type II toxin-antitoxin system RelE/ParE family toxin [Coriobacteriia bacterium]
MPKEVMWIASSLRDLQAFPDSVKQAMGFALFQAQCGGKHVQAKPLKGFKGGGVLEVVEDYDGDTFRTMYTVRFSDVVYVLHSFQKKAKKGTETPKHEIDIVKARLRMAAQLHEQRAKQKKGK